MTAISHNFRGSIPVLIAIGLLAGQSGCFCAPSNEYRVIVQSADKRIAASETDPSRDSISEIIDDEPNRDRSDKNPIKLVVASNVFREPVSPPDIVNSHQVKLLVPNKTFPTDRRSGALRVIFDDLNLLNVLNMDPVTNNAVELMPDWMTSLAGKLVRVRGYMYPTYDADGLEQFVLLRDNQECCYGPLAKIYDHIQVQMKPGTTATYVPIQQPMDVVGRFKIDLQSANGSVFGLYAIEDAVVVKR